MLPAGTVLDNRYEILEPLGQGGMGAVFRARRRMLGDEVAIKIVRSDFAADPAARERFMRESRAAAQLRHPNIVSILDFNLDPEGRPFLVMELLNGRSLYDEIGVRGALPVDEVRAIVGPLCGALQLAHDHGILHRDLKPANIVAHDFGGGVRVHKLVDFGLVRDVASDATRLTGSQNFIGTFMYAAPEQLRGDEADARADQYSLAVVVYEMLTGRPPIEASDSTTLVTAVLTKPAPPPTSRREGLPKWVDVVLGRALAKSPADRYPSVAAFGQALQSAGSQGETTVVMSGVAPAGPAGGGLLGTYDLGERLGPGRLGSEVFSGTHRALGHPVAIRLLRRSGDRNWEAIRARFLREARTLQIVHPSVIQVRDYGEEGDLVYLVTDFIDGPSLRQLLADEGPMPWSRLRPLLEQLTGATHALHRKGGLLCGVSPDIIRVARDEDGERILISTAGIWQASDLLATLTDETLRGTALADAELHYIAPEFLTGETAGTRSDVFTMGVLAYEMATGRAPYQGQTMQALLGAMLRGRPRDPRELQPTLPAAASAAIVTALSPDPGERYESARALAAAMLA